MASGVPSSSSHAFSMEAVAALRGFELLTRCVYVPPLTQPSPVEAEPCFCSSTDHTDSACHDTECINYATYVECPLDRCPTGHACRNQRLQRPELFPRLEPFQTELKGFGVRTTERVRALDPVGEYVGEIIGQKELYRRTSGLGRTETNFYYLQLSNGVYIDARHRGGFTRFVNHSCKPNCKAEKWTVGGETRLLVFALRDLEPGEELTFDYQWTVLGRQRIKCFCGEVECKGFIGDEVEKKPMDTPDGVFQDPTDTDSIDEHLVGRTLRLFNASSTSDGCNGSTVPSTFSVVLVKSFDPTTQEHTVVDATVDGTNSPTYSRINRRRQRPSNRYDTSSSSSDDEISLGDSKPASHDTSRRVNLSTIQWQVYIDLRGMSPDAVQKAVFSIPKLNRPPRRPDAQVSLSSAVPSAPASPLYLTPPQPSTPTLSNGMPQLQTYKLLLKGLPPAVNAALLKRMLGHRAGTLVAMDLFFMDTPIFGRVGWGLVEFSDAGVFEAMRARFDNKPFLTTTVRSFLATDQGIAGFHRMKQHVRRTATDNPGSRPSSSSSHRPPSRQHLRSDSPMNLSPMATTSASATTSCPSHTTPSSLPPPTLDEYCMGRKLNWVVESSSPEWNYVSPSRKAGLSAAVEATLQTNCTKIIVSVVKMLKFNREDFATAVVLFHRYVSTHTMNVSTIEWMAATCLHVVLKAHSRQFDWNTFLTTVYTAKYNGGTGDADAAPPSAQELKRVEHLVLSMEAPLLEGLRFDISSTDPFAMLDACFRGGNLDADDRAHKFGKRLVTDILPVTSLWVQFHVECLVVAVLYIASAAAATATHPHELPSPPPYLPRLLASHRYTFDCAITQLLTIFYAARCTDLPRSTVEQRIQQFLDAQDACGAPAILFLPSTWPSAFLARQAPHHRVQLMASHVECVTSIRRRAFVGRVKTTGVPWPELAGRAVYLQPWPYRQSASSHHHHPSRGMPDACLRELSTLVNVHARAPTLFVAPVGILFPRRGGDDVAHEASSATMDIHTDWFPVDKADRHSFRHGSKSSEAKPTLSKTLQENVHYLVYDRPLHTVSTLLESTADAGILSFATRKRMLYHLLQSVAMCHEQNIVHRFLSPANLFVFAKYVKLGGFHCARHVDTKGATTLRGYVLSDSEHLEHCTGSALHLAAPELLLGDKVFTKRSDVWSLGIVGLQIMLHGPPLIVGRDVPKQLEYLYRICGSPREDLWPDAMHLPNFVQPNRKYQTRLRKVILERMQSFPDAGIEVFENLLALDPKRRWHAKRALQAPWFADQDDAILFDFSTIPPTLENAASTSFHHHKDKGLPSSAKKRKGHHGEHTDKSTRDRHHHRHHRRSGGSATGSVDDAVR
ncbi:serine/threonine protein kinase [Aphanomyces invadans]|uniref:Serine/threonine protein kinase n=1 Tax=Aphanomyces invadans TaxID=157072 RepID=A0A024UTL7_9STRA|nr:serine/threonine protein kinase [Aphanomyces invadans]ETW09272.1 serine/threonine protein kinase [Aphanomyces invadans]|eukprot:XP_008863077.1 serine/threonine protein kinase [Aphanomyces invadans]